MAVEQNFVIALAVEQHVPVGVERELRDLADDLLELSLIHISGLSVELLRRIDAFSGFGSADLGNFLWRNVHEPRAGDRSNGTKLL